MSKKVQQQDVRHSRGPVPAKSKRTPTGQPDRPVFELNAAGIDIGAREIYVACLLTAMSSLSASAKLSLAICIRWPNG